MPDAPISVTTRGGFRLGTGRQKLLQGAFSSHEEAGLRGRVGPQADIGGFHDDAGTAHPVDCLCPGRLVLNRDELQSAQQFHELRHERRGGQMPALQPSLGGRGGDLSYRGGAPDRQASPAPCRCHLLRQGAAAERREHVDYPKGCHLKGGLSARIIGLK
ncbi:hypothetical protein SK1NUM_20810 [Arachnia rubra]|nr:hypothetical protein SK1NUM_20810 [Arachnia rubra]